MTVTKLECPKCKNLFSTRAGNYSRHVSVCDGNYTPFVKLGKCKHCGTPFTDSMSNNKRMNHSRWCERNLKVRDVSQLNTPEAIEKRVLSIKKAHADGKYAKAAQKAVATRARLGKLKHSDSTKIKLREKALLSPHRRLRRKMIRYKGIMLDSSWELALAQRLDEQVILWTRPAPLTWIDEAGQSHHYFPDFYLPEYDLYLDPKNPIAMNTQKKKLDLLLAQYPNIRIIPSLEECRSFVV